MLDLIHVIHMVSSKNNVKYFASKSNLCILLCNVNDDCQSWCDKNNIYSKNINYCKNQLTWPINGGCFQMNKSVSTTRKTTVICLYMLLPLIQSLFINSQSDYFLMSYVKGTLGLHLPNNGHLSVIVNCYTAGVYW